MEASVTRNETPVTRGRTWVSHVTRSWLAYWWFLSAVSGVVALSVLGGTPRVRLLLPIAIMTIYFYVGIRLKEKNTARFADSLYFLGFLWTLWALIDSLVIRSQGEAITAQQVFLMFGYALVTTAMGMFLRMALIQFDRTLPDQVVDARKEIDDRVVAFTAALQAAEEQIIRSHERTATSIGNMADGLSKTVAKVEEEFERQHIEAARVTAGRLRESVVGLVDEITAMRGPYKDMAVEAAAVVKHLRDLGETLSQQVADATGSLGGHIEGFRVRLHESAARLDQALSGSAGKLDRSVGSTGEVLGRVAGQVKVVEQSAEAATQAVREFAQRAAHSTVELDAAVRRSAEALKDRTADLLNALEGATQTGKDSGRRVNAATVSLEKVAAQASRLEEALGAFLGSLKTMESHAAGLGASAVQKTGEQIQLTQRAIHEARAAGNDLSKAVAEIAGFIRSGMAGRR